MLKILRKEEIAENATFGSLVGKPLLSSLVLLPRALAYEQ